MINLQFDNYVHVRIYTDLIIVLKSTETAQPYKIPTHNYQMPVAFSTKRYIVTIYPITTLI